MPPEPDLDPAPRYGAFGRFGGMFASELLLPALHELAAASTTLLRTPALRARIDGELAHWAGRPTPLCECPRLSARAGLRILLKREDLLHGGAHKTNNVVGQALLAQAMGKTRLIAETGAGQHGVATAMIGARLGLETVVYMGARDVERQAVNVERMRLCGASVVPVANGSATLKDAIDEALRDWASNLQRTHYLLGTVCGPHPFPTLVRELQSVIGREARAQCLERLGALPEVVVACVGGGSNALGVFAGFVADEHVELVGVEAAGRGLDGDAHAATLTRGRVGLLHGARTYVLQDDDGQVQRTHSVAAGLDYPGVGPEHAALHERRRARYTTARDDEALAAFAVLAREEGIVPALESAHALAFVLRAVGTGELGRSATVLVNLSGRGDKDLATFAALGRAGAS